MKRLLLLPMLCLPGIALAQTSLRDEAETAIIAEITGDGLSEAQALGIADCFLSRMTEAEMGAYLEAETPDDRDEVMTNINLWAAASTCAANFL